MDPKDLSNLQKPMAYSAPKFSPPLLLPPPPPLWWHSGRTRVAVSLSSAQVYGSVALGSGVCKVWPGGSSHSETWVAAHEILIQWELWGRHSLTDPLGQLFL